VSAKRLFLDKQSSLVLRTSEQIKFLIDTESRITKIETVRSLIQPNVTHVLVTDSVGITGLGETFYGAGAVEAHIHEVIVPTLVSEHPVATPDSVAEYIHGYVGYSGSGAEVRARSALDTALWDLAAKRAGLPLRKLISPDAADAMPSYNTCSGLKYVNAESRQSSSNWGLNGDKRPVGDYEDLWAFLNEPARLARELVDAGYTGMKVWPFDLVAESSKGGSDADLKFGLSVLSAIREEVGMEIDLYLELHSLWKPEAAKKLLSQLEEFSLSWVEDPIRADQIPDLAKLTKSAKMPIACGENLGAGANGYLSMIEKRAVDVMIMDLGWCGGISDALPLVKLSNDAIMEVAFHDCTGPVSLAIATELSLASPNAKVQEVARAFWHGWYSEMAVGYPELSRGQVLASDSPGHGASLRPEFLVAAGTAVRQSTLKYCR
jgi:L-alanine-DL-glutamate epimerase-like enolase superfamily enzyme